MRESTRKRIWLGKGRRAAKKTHPNVVKKGEKKRHRGQGEGRWGSAVLDEGRHSNLITVCRMACVVRGVKKRRC